MSRSKKGPKRTASGWPHVYNLRNRHGRDRFYFWKGRKGDPQVRVQDDVIVGQVFMAAYARFLADLHPYEDRSLRALQRAHQTAVSAGDDPVYPRGTVGWLIGEHEASDKFKRQKNIKAISGQLKWARTQPLRPTDPNSP